MTLTSRLDRIAAALGGDGEPGIVVVFVGDDGAWQTADGQEVDRAALNPTIQVAVFSSRSDGPQ